MSLKTQRIAAAILPMIYTVYAAIEIKKYARSVFMMTDNNIPGGDDIWNGETIYS
jgi:hypothetical protein